MENFLQEIYRRLRSNQVGVFIDGEILGSNNLQSLSILKERLKEVGEVRFAQVMYENNIPQKDFDYLRQSGFTDTVVPGNIELSFLLEIYDIVLEKKVDFIVIGTTREELIPLFTELRKSVTVFAFIDDLNSVSKAFVESFDGIITVDTIEDFTFNAPNFSEFDQIVNGSNMEWGKVPDYTMSNQPSEDEANIGTFSEEIIEDDIIEEMKKEKKS